MKPPIEFRQRYSCGTHVTGHGRAIASRHGTLLSSHDERKIEKGVIITMPGREGDPYTVLDEQSFVVLEAREEQLTAVADAGEIPAMEAQGERI